MTDKPPNLQQIKWAIESRARNQMSIVRLLELFDKYEPRWKSKKYSRAAQDLASTAFSLWRAAFLADKSIKRSDVFTKGHAFLTRVVEENAIGFPQDKQWRDGRSITTAVMLNILYSISREHGAMWHQSSSIR